MSYNPLLQCICGQAILFLMVYTLFVCFFFPKVYLFFNFWLCSIFIAEHGLSLVVESRAYSLGVVCGLLITVAYLVLERRFQGVQASVVVGPRLQSTGLVVVICSLSFPLHVESSWSRDQTHFPCIDSQILTHQTTRGALCSCSPSLLVSDFLFHKYKQTSNADSCHLRVCSTLPSIDSVLSLHIYHTSVMLDYHSFPAQLELN